MDRIRNCCTPQHAKKKLRKTPCAETGHCHDCSASDRICKVTMIIEKNPNKTDISVIVVDQDLGLGWNVDWPQERIEKIYAQYAEVTLMKRPAWLKVES